MQPKHTNSVSPSVLSSTKNLATRRPNQLGVDTRRFAGIFPQDSPEGVSDCGDATDEEQYGDSDSLRLEFVTALEKTACSAQIASASNISVHEGSTVSAAQRVVARYRAAHGDPDSSERATTEINEKELPRVIPDDQRSMYTLAAPVDPQVTMDMMWRPKPKVLMRHTDQLALMEAQSQAVAMMQKAGLKLTDKIQCRRRGCADILADVEALKYHLHIHNITDMPTTRTNFSPSSCLPSLPECGSSSNPKTLKRTHSRSKSSVEARGNGSKASTLSRKHSARSLLPLHPSPRESIREAPSLSSSVEGHRPGKSTGPSPTHNKKKPAKHLKTHSRGRKLTKDSAGSAGADHPNIAMLLSPPPSPRRGRLFPTPPTNTLMSFALNSEAEGEKENGVAFSIENAVPEKLVRSRSPLRALSPTRALSPIRDGIRRAFGYSAEPTNE